MLIDPGSALLDAIEVAVGRSDVVVEEARREVLDYDAFLAHRIVSRISGTAFAGGTRYPWSLIEKVTEGPALASSYLRDNAVREHAAYTSGLLDGLAPGIRAPRLLGSDTDATGRITLWLEEIGLGTPRPLDADTLFAAAHDLGGLAGQWVGRIPREPWLFTGWIDRHSQPEAIGEGLDVLSRQHPAVVSRLGERRESALRLVRAQGWVRDILEALPHTLCHHDAVGANVFRTNGGTVLIDWESVGPGPVGADLASLLFSSARRGDCSAELAASIVDEAVETYARGTGGVSAVEVRRGFDAAVSLRWKLVLDIANALERVAPIRRGSAPQETDAAALAELDSLVDLLLECAGRVLTK